MLRSHVDGGLRIKDSDNCKRKSSNGIPTRRMFFFPRYVIGTFITVGKRVLVFFLKKMKCSYDVALEEKLEILPVIMLYQGHADAHAR